MLHEEEVHTLLEHLPPHQPGQTTWTAIDLQGFTSDQKEIYKCLEDNQKKVLTYLHRPIRKILNLSSRGVSAEDDGNDPRGQGRSQTPLVRESTSSPAVSTSKGKNTVPDPPVNQASLNPGKSLKPSPSFEERLNHGPGPNPNVLAGILPEELAAFRAYQAAIRNPDSLEMKVKELCLEDIKPTIIKTKIATNNARVKNTSMLLTTPVAMEISDDDDDEDDPVPVCKDVVQAGKSLKAANVRKFTGSADQDAHIYYERFSLQLDFIFADPSIRLPLAFQWCGGPALTALQKAMKDKLAPRTMKQREDLW